MVDNFVSKANELMKEGDKKYKGTAFKNLFSNKAERAEKALDLYKQAATNYKLSKSWSDASEAFIRCKDCSLALGDDNEAANFLVEASNMTRKVNSADAITLIDEAIQIYIKENRISMAAKLKKSTAEMYEQDQEFTLAIKFYNEAADLFYAEHDYSSDFNNCKLKVAELAINLPDFSLTDIIKIYEQVGEKYLENKLTEPSAKALFFKACLLYIANDDQVGCQMALEKYADKSPSFNGTRQFKFVQSVLKCVESSNLDAFSEECNNFNQIIPLDKWMINVLTKIKTKLNPVVNEEEAKKADFL